MMDPFRYPKRAGTGKLELEMHKYSCKMVVYKKIRGEKLYGKERKEGIKNAFSL